MKKKDLKMLSKKPVKALWQDVVEKKTKLEELHARIKSGQEKDVKSAKKMKVEIAQTLSIIREKELKGGGQDEDS